MTWISVLAAKATCRERYLQFGCEGMATKIKAESLDAIASMYRSGKLEQVVNEGFARKVVSPRG